MALVFFDFETGGTQESHPNIQLAAIAVDDNWSIKGLFEMKIAFDEQVADPAALEMNHYDREVWARDAKLEQVVLAQFDVFLASHKTVPMVSKRTGRPYSVARLAGHNILGFDVPRLKRMYGERFMPVHPIALDTLQLSLWYFQGRREQPTDFKLGSLARFFDIPQPEAHAALDDVRTSLELAKRMSRYSA